MTAGLRTPLMLADAHGRVATDLRVSLTDRCNLRCTYCMPAEGLQWFPGEDVLTDAELGRLLRVGVELLGITKIRFTGGEPLLRRSLEHIVADAKSLRTRTGGTPELSLTSNGIGLDKRVSALAAAGLDRVNISLDSLDPQRYAAIARRDRLDAVLAGLAAAEAAGLLPVKVNSVIMRDANEIDVVPLAEFCLERGYQLRYIEQMPLGPRHQWDRSKMVTQAEILARLGERFELRPATEPRGAAPAELWRVAPDATQPGGLLGVIPSVTAPFCGACDRTRVTADGQLRTCLFSRTETDLRTPLREGATDAELAELWAGAQSLKAAAHGIGEPGFVPPSRTMSAIGG
ncbi:MAG: GTP 3',8-cyclase MoaA [Micropruina sp.]|uniref:GTP 3',8-cyclase MoaA n=1 Tax=Micropruina sp. TaxID=2737536 RepID=UPI0039E4F395